MPIRNLDPAEMFIRMANDHTPKYHFTGSSKADFDAWKKDAVPEVLACLGNMPDRVDPNPELVIEFEYKGIRQQRWMIDVHEHLSAVLLINFPAGMSDNEQVPAICCWHGHGAFGKDPVMGDDSSPDKARSIADHQYDYGFQMAQKGFITYAIDAIGFGERHPNNKPNHSMNPGGRDWCNLLYLASTMFGSTSIAINVMHGKMATDFVAGLDCVDEHNLGVMGLSGGGTCTTWSYFCDERFKAAEIICYHDLWEVFLLRDQNACGMQVAPGLYSLVDLPDLQGLLAPRPLLIDIGVRDSCFTVDSTMEAKKQIEKIYAAADASDKLLFDIHPNEHAWGANEAEGFFRKHLL